MERPSVSTRRAAPSDVDQIVELSSRVQAALAESGSLQGIDLLQSTKVAAAVDDGLCFIAEDPSQKLLGCAFTKSITEDYFETANAFTFAASPRPLHYVHSIMLKPDVQGHGMGLTLFEDVVELLGTILLDCWAGSNKLRNVYQRAGCTLQAVLPENDYEIAVYIRPLQHEVMKELGTIDSEPNHSKHGE